MEIIRKGNLLAIGLEPDELLLESIQTALDREGVRDGVVLSGIGTLKTCTLHAITGTIAAEQPIHLTLQPVHLRPHIT